MLLSHFSCVQLFVTPWTVACQAPLSMGFSRQEYWSGLPCPPPGDLPKPGFKVESLISPALAGGFFTTSTTWEAHLLVLSELLPLPPGVWIFRGQPWFYVPHDPSVGAPEGLTSHP